MFVHSMLPAIIVVICFLFWVAIAYTRKPSIILRIAGGFFLVFNTVYWIWKL